MIKEIGSEFWSVPYCEKENDLFPENTKWFLAGRSAIRYIINDIRAKREFNSVALPDWCCESIIQPFLDADIDVKFYSVYIDEKGRFCQDFTIAQSCDALYLMDFFGYSTPTPVSDFPFVCIRDATHSLFATSYKADYTFGSLRKWAGFYTGGYAWANKGWNTDTPLEPVDEDYYFMRRSAMLAKENYLLNGGSKDYLKTFAEAEDYLDNIKSIPAAAQRDIKMAKHLDVEFIKKRRRENAEILLERFEDKAIFKLHDDDCPLFVPILIKDGSRDLLRKYLINNNIFLPVHWPNGDLDGKELSLVCDQRYDKEEMLRICEAIKEFYA